MKLYFSIVLCIIVTAYRTYAFHEPSFHVKYKYHSQKVCTNEKCRTKRELQMLTPFINAPTLLSAIAVAGVVAFHEAGHFLAARVQGIKVQSFNIGYGPKLLAFNDSSNIEYALRAFPFGGYVSFPANVEQNENGEITKELTDPELLQNRSPLQRLFVISAGVVANILLTILLTMAASFNQGITTPVYENGVYITSINNPRSPAYQSGLRPTDTIVKVDNKMLTGSDTVVQDFIRYTMAHKGQPMVLEVYRPPSVLSTSPAPTSFTPLPALSSMTLEKRIVTPAPNEQGRVSIGISIKPRVKETITVKAKNIFEAIPVSVQTTMRMIFLTWNAFMTAAMNGFSGSDVGGPISVITTGSELARSSSNAFLGFMAAISVNLAVLNALPYPALDGGQFVFAFIELISGKKVPRRIETAITGVAIIAIALFSLSTIALDLSRLGGPTGAASMLNSPLR